MRYLWVEKRKTYYDCIKEVEEEKIAINKIVPGKLNEDCLINH